MAASIVFDFDGTLAVGHGPVRAYARAVAERAQPRFRERVDVALKNYDLGENRYRDGYDIVGSFAAEDGISEEELQEAYVRSRKELGSEAAPVATMPGIRGFLVELRRSARLILATNAPEPGIRRVLDSWGIAAEFDELHFESSKPAGLLPIVTRLRESGAVLSIGDIPEFDLVPAKQLGADTALVGPAAATSDFPATFRGPSLAALRPAIETWAVTAASSTLASPDAQSSPER